MSELTYALFGRGGPEGLLFSVVAVCVAVAIVLPLADVVCGWWLDRSQPKPSAKRDRGVDVRV